MHNNRSKAHRHGWECFRESGGYTNAMEQGTPLAERIESVYKTAYATGYKNRGLDDLERTNALNRAVLFDDDTDVKGK